MTTVKRNQIWFQSAVFILGILMFVSSANGNYLDNISGSHDNTIAESSTKVPFRFRRVTKTERQDSYNVRIEYDGPPVLPKVVYTIRLSKVDRWTEVTNPQANGVLEVDIPKTDSQEESKCEPFECGGTKFNFIYADETYSMTVFLNGSESTMEIPPASVTVAPVTGNGVTVKGNNIIFKSGSKLLFDITFSLREDTEYATVDRFDAMYYIKSEKDDRVIRLYGPRTPAVNLVPVDGYNHKSRWDTIRAELNSTVREDLEGILELSMDVRFYCGPNPCLVSTINVPYSAKFYRDDHEGPFGSEDFIGFITDEHQIRSNDTVLCSNREDTKRPCEIRCEAFGGNDLRTNIIPIDRYLPKMDLHTMEMPELGYASSVLTIPEVSYSDAGTYMCQATNRNGVTKYKTFQLGVIREPRIDRERSKVTRFENGSLLATCIANGDPIPNVKFDNPYELEPSDYVITFTDLDESTRKVELFIEDPEAAERVYSFRCDVSLDMISEFWWGDDLYMPKEN